jgi:hypothetical protein
MNYFVQVRDNLVIQSMVVASSDCDNKPFPESEPIGQAFIASLGVEGEWLQTSENGDFRGCYAGLGFTYDEESDTFVAPEVPQP